MLLNDLSEKAGCDMITDGQTEFCNCKSPGKNKQTKTSSFYAIGVEFELCNNRLLVKWSVWKTAWRASKTEDHKLDIQVNFMNKKQ